VDKDEIKGIITDGDLRRMLSTSSDFSKITASKIMSIKPKLIEEDEMAIEAVKKMKESNISQLLVVKGSKYVGVVHFQDLLKEGII
jgi:arabinose-5-phosphate isomerase